MMKLTESIEDYLRYLQHEQGAARTTYKAYHAYLNNFHHWLTENGYAEPLLSDFNTATVRRFFYAVSSMGLRPRSIYGYIIPLRSYGAFLVRHNILKENPALCVKLPKKDAGTRREASEEEITLLLQAVDRQRNKQRAAFQKAVLSVLVHTGLRRAEVCDVKLPHVDLDGGWLLVANGKGGKSRKVPLCADVSDALRAYLAVRPADTQHDYLFTIDRRRRMYYEGVRSVVEEAKAFAGLADRSHITPHALRHALACRLMRNGASLLDVMTWLGHSQIATTQRYLHANEEAIRNTASYASVLMPKAQPQEAENVIRLPRSDRERNRLRRIAR